jgi:hypothetical protein
MRWDYNIYLESQITFKSSQTESRELTKSLKGKLQGMF